MFYIENPNLSSTNIPASKCEVRNGLATNLHFSLPVLLLVFPEQDVLRRLNCARQGFVELGKAAYKFLRRLRLSLPRIVCGQVQRLYGSFCDKAISDLASP